MKVGQTVVSGKDATPEVGNALYLADIPLGATIHNIELRPGRWCYGKKCRSLCSTYGT